MKEHYNTKYKKICVVTASRSEYGYLRWVIDEVFHDDNLELILVVTGAHLSKEQGNTIKDIERDGYPISACIDMHLENEEPYNIVNSMGHCCFGMASTLKKLKPDIIVVLGDRYELLPICSAALLMNIPIAHISGGDITEGAIDDSIRNAVTMLASLHFPGVVESAKNIERMRGSKKNIYAVGELSLELFHRLKLMDRKYLSENLNIDSSKKWVLLTYHPETKQTLEYNMNAMVNIIAALNSFDDIIVVMSKANADYGGLQINEYLEKTANQYSDKFKLYSSLGQLRYLSFMKQVWCVIGNSSSGIVEAPFLHIPVINIGNRQKGRHQCSNIIQTDIELKSILSAIGNIENFTFSTEDSNYWGDGNSARKIVDVIKNYE